MREGLLTVTDAAVVEMEELREMIAAGQERGFLTSEAIAAAIEEAGLSGEQTHDLFSYLEEHGIDVLDPGDAGDGSRSPQDDHDGGDSIPEADVLAQAGEDVAPAGVEEQDGGEEHREGRPSGLRAPEEELRRAEVDLTVEPGVDSLRLYLRSIGRVPLLSTE